MRTMSLLFMILFYLTLSFSCGKREKNKSVISLNNQIQLSEKVKIIEFNQFSSARPVNFDLDKHTVTRIDGDSVYLIEYVYKKGLLADSLVIKSYENAKNNGHLFSKIPLSLLNGNQNFNYLEGQDEEGTKIGFLLSNGGRVDWKLSTRRHEYPQEVLSFYEMLMKTQQKLDKLKGL